MLEPEPDTVERWAWDYLHTRSLALKLDPSPLPDLWEVQPTARRVVRPGRPPELRVAAKAEKTRGIGSPSGRARTMHTFLHHELQAAELMAWAILAFPDAPRQFRAGLARIVVDEARHMRAYAGHIEALGHGVGDFVVRDWFWERVPTSLTPASFVATMGLGFESANLEHTASFAARFRAAGDEAGAQIQELVGREEIAHVRFGTNWFATFTGALRFDDWVKALPAPLSPLLMRGRPLERGARAKAGQSADFLDRLEAWQPATPGS